MFDTSESFTIDDDWNKKGKVKDTNLREYNVEYRKYGEQVWNLIAKETTNINNGILASWNNMSLVSDTTYELRLSAFDSVNNTSYDSLILKAIAVQQFEFGKYGENSGNFIAPEDVYIHTDGKIYVVDTGNHRVQIFDTSGNFVKGFGSLGTVAGKLNSPKGLAIDDMGNILVTDSNNNRVQVFNTAGNYETSFDCLSKPQGIARAVNGNIYVVNGGANCINIYSSNYNLIKTFGLNGNGSGYLNSPKNISIDKSGMIYIADSGNSRVQIFDAEGNFINNFNTECRKIALDSNGNIFALDGINRRVKKYDASGNLIVIFPIFQEKGQLNTQAAAGIAVDMNNNIYIANFNRIEKFKLTNFGKSLPDITAKVIYPLKNMKLPRNKNIIVGEA